MRDKRSEAEGAGQRRDPKRRERSSFSITTAIPYVNGPPHIGHALEFCEADVIARYHRLQGEEVYFLTGTDEHGTKIVQTAEKAGLPVKTLIDQNVKKFQDMLKQFGISYDDFIRTTDRKRHWPSAQKLWKEMEKKGDIYKGSYTGLYCVGCEEFKLEKDLFKGLCPNHDKAPERITQENYFFRLSKYSKKIGQILKSKKVKIVPEFRAHEIIAMCDRGLEDTSFSRPKEQLSWGIPVPGDSSQVMYVWCDALTNYISAMDYVKKGKKFKKFWPVDVHVIGKDILRFHAGIWIGMLLSAGIPLPKAELIHGWVHYQGGRMSKSKGNVVDPVELADHYGVAQARYYLLSEIPVGLDGDFSYALFEAKINSDLANNLGNFVNRVLTMTQRFWNGKIPKGKSLSVPELKKFWKGYNDAFQDFDHQKAAQKMIALVNFGNKFIAEQRPWEMAKEPKKSKKLDIVLGKMLQLVLHTAFMLVPFCPDKAELMMKSLGLEKSLNAKGLEALKTDKLLAKKLQVPDLLFSRVEKERSWISKDEMKTSLPALPLPVSEEAKKLNLPIVAFAMTGLKPLGTSVEKRLKKEWEQWIHDLRFRPEAEQKAVLEIIEKAYHLNHSLGVPRTDIPGNALLQQFLSDPTKKIPFINPLVALYNFVEAKYGFSLGAHDLAALKGDVWLKICDGSEHYLPLGSEGLKKVPKGSYAYCDDEGKRVLCWLEVKQGQETAVTDKTTQVLFVVQGYSGIKLEEIQKAADELKGLVKQWML